MLIDSNLSLAYVNWKSNYLLKYVYFRPFHVAPAGLHQWYRCKGEQHLKSVTQGFRCELCLSTLAHRQCTKTCNATAQNRTNSIPCIPEKLNLRDTTAFPTPTVAKKYAEINTFWNSIARFQNIYLRTKKFA